VIAEQQSEGRDFVGGRLEKSEGTRAGEKLRGDYQKDGQGGQGRSVRHGMAWYGLFGPGASRCWRGIPGGPSNVEMDDLM
jgi:hypothetical protein